MSIEGLRTALGDRALVAEPMSRHTSYGIGGPADLFVVARSLEELCQFVGLACEHQVPHLIIGEGANLLVADAGVRGLVIRNACQAVEIAQKTDTVWQVVAESGAVLRDLARQTVSHGLAGLEWAIDVPGTVGGAVVGNAGAYGGYVSDNLRGVVVWSSDAGESWLPSTELGLGYRTSLFKGEAKEGAATAVIQSATFDLRASDTACLQERASEYQARRSASQPCGRSAGSVFKRTEQYPAGFLIENAGLKGRRIGGAVVSLKHANFILNQGTASARDVRQLIELIQETVQREFGIRLELEIELVGAW